MTDIEMPDEFADALSTLSRARRRLREPLRPAELTEAWRAGFVAARVAATRVTVKEWGGSRYPTHRALPFVFEFACPFGHRTADRTDIAKVRLIIEDDGWPSLDPASPCDRCGQADLEGWALTCPMCEAGEDHERHFPDHEPLDVLTMYDGIDYDDSSGGFDASPVAWVMREFVRLAQIAAARWWIEHTDEAAQSAPKGVTDRQRAVSNRLALAREVINAVPKTKKKSVKPPMTAEAGAAWLDEKGIPVCGEKATWKLVKDLPGCPAQSVIFAAVKVRKSRTT